MSQTETIKIYGRIRPFKVNRNIAHDPNNNQSKYLLEKENEGDYKKDKLTIQVTKANAFDIINNQKEKYEYLFNGVFDMDAKQDDVFQVVAQDVVNSALDGFNGTIFAYGQTGSGKTFTITGGAERYSDRGLIPRTLQYIFKEISRRKDYSYTVQISYLEIYNENGYDLLDDTRDAKKLEDLQKVSLMEDDDQVIHIKNLSCHTANNEEEALNWLFVGDTNRMIAETPSNPSSSRSHCIFIISLIARKIGSDVVLKSKLHLVDLAGSERVSKTQIDGTLLKEAKHINLSLHFLEQVIVSLHEKSMGKRAHVPYRNSMMTSVLRDSLGGNCKTTMIATIAMENNLIEESLSTCRFAQRVALIRNDAKKNEEIDPYLIIEKLKIEISQLKEEISLLRGGESSEELTENEKEECREAVNTYLKTGFDIQYRDFRKIRYCYSIIKNFINTSGSTETNAKGFGEVDSVQIKKLEQQVQHRDQEISVLIEMLKKYKAKDSSVEGKKYNVEKTVNDIWAQKTNERSDDALLDSTANKARILTSSTTDTLPTPQITNKFLDFDAYLQARPDESAKLQNAQKQMMQKVAYARSLGEQLTSLKDEILKTKTTLEKYRASVAVNQLKDGSASLDQQSEEEKILRMRLNESKSAYQRIVEPLREVKTEIGHLKHSIDTIRIQLQQGYEKWKVENELADKIQSTQRMEIFPGDSNKSILSRPTSSWSGTRNNSIVMRPGSSKMFK
ncbi:Kinesin, motor region domain-containing protein [Rozella allomycis CSF55]|uniref:Kinesin-like protein n=1 Tax=Rozella allomycis (strain CSF55) TaxID=988480 RepID=A0A075AZY3_ROZAC|nr:Kinesin, motor region domain-containing protein [Rozella allomycis CSF55]|eukprot:EPZ35674.1 Kinesin, motor region domain-containing protein [Rozella allomycis CSF55]